MASAAVRSNPPLSVGCGYQFGYHFPGLSTRVPDSRNTGLLAIRPTCSQPRCQSGGGDG